MRPASGIRTYRREAVAVVAVIACVCALFGGLGGRAQSRGNAPVPRYVWLAREAVLLQPAQVIALAAAHWTEWSPDGSHVVVFRSEPPFKPDVLQDVQQNNAPDTTMSLLLWSSATRRAFSVWKHDGVPEYMTHAKWLAGTQTAVVPVHWSEQTMQANADGAQKQVVTQHRTLLFVDTAREVVHEAALPPHADYEFNPVKPQLLLYDEADSTARVLDKSGVAGAALVLPKKSEYMSVGWMPDGNAIRLGWLEKVEKTADTPAHNVRRGARFDLTTQDVTPLDKAALSGDDPSPLPSGYAGPLRVTQTVQAVRQGQATQRIRPLWLESKVASERAQTLLCADGMEAQISPRGNAVAYLSQGVAWVTPLSYAPREAFMQVLRAQTFGNAKQSMTAVLMYAQDYDEMYPAASGRLGDSISPYLKDPDILDGLNYTYAGGPIGDIQNPSTTVMGTYTGPGGTAILYADGHVKWKVN